MNVISSACRFSASTSRGWRCPRLITIAPPQASRYSRPSASRMRQPSAWTATGSARPGEAVRESRTVSLPWGHHPTALASAGAMAPTRSGAPRDDYASAPHGPPRAPLRSIECRPGRACPRRSSTCPSTRSGRATTRTPTSTSRSGCWRPTATTHGSSCRSSRRSAPCSAAWTRRSPSCASARAARRDDGVWVPGWDELRRPGPRGRRRDGAVGDGALDRGRLRAVLPPGDGVPRLAGPADAGGDQRARRGRGGARQADHVLPARHDHYRVQTGDGYAAHVAGAIGVSTDAQASWWGGRGSAPSRTAWWRRTAAIP